MPNPERLTKEQAAIVGAYTGFTAGSFSDIHEYAEKLFGRPVWTHEFADKEIAQKLSDLAKPDFLAICHEEAA